MNVVYSKSFVKDLKKINNRSVFENIKNALINLENSERLALVKNCKKMVGYSNAYRIRVNDYRIAFYFTNDIVEVMFVRHRKIIYNDFPDC